MRVWQGPRGVKTGQLTGTAGVRYTAVGSGAPRSTLAQGDVAQLVRAGVSYALGPWFESTHRHCWVVFLALCIAVAAGCAAPLDRSGRDQSPEDNSEKTPTDLHQQLCQGPGCFELGGQIAGSLDDAKGVMTSAGMTWVKHQHKFTGNTDASSLAGVIEGAHAQNFKVLISVTGPERPTSIDFDAAETFFGQLAARGPDAIEVWNEPNIDREWPAGSIGGTDYVNNLLRPAHAAIKAANPNVIVVAGAPAPTGYFGAAGCTESGCNDDVFVTQMAAAGAATVMDCMGVHHNSGATSPSAESGHPADDPADGNHYSWYLKPQMQTYAQALNSAVPLCVTEFGYLSMDGYGPPPAQFGWAKDTSVEDHAAWLGEAARLFATEEIPNVRFAIVFNVNFSGGGDDPQAGYAIVRADNSCPACDTLSAAMQEP